ncbi:MAG: ABC transporter permease [Deltaproteobacteria bacterium]|nr:ABC transporter permease [Deltaproteobacteria bacterium]MDL1960479.1 ABC transporter permease [Deltaproteobacteria bacterium]
MRIGVIKAYFKKELLDIYRSKLILMVYIMPSMLLILFGYGIKTEVTHTRTLIIDNDQSKVSYDLVSTFEHSKYFNSDVKNLSENRALNLIKQDKKDLIIIIPEAFEKHLLKGLKTSVGVYIDGSFPSRAKTIENYVNGVIYDAIMKRSGSEVDRALITINARNLFNQSLRDEDMIVPGVIGLVLLIAPAVLSALLIVKEKENGTIFNFYSSSVKKIEFLAAKILPVLLLHGINIFILFLWAIYLFGVPFRGSFLLYTFSSFIYIIISLSVGLLVSIITSSQIVAYVLTLIVTIIPGFLYSGMLMPISSMEGESVIEAHIYPVMYYTHILYDVFLVGDGLSASKNLLYLLILVGYAIILLGIGSLLLKKRIA